jgi:hypothetical protein
MNFYAILTHVINNTASTHDQDVFSFYPDERPCNGFQEALARYREIGPHLRLSGMQVHYIFYYLEYIIINV